jgi:hypothetical protein
MRIHLTGITVRSGSAVAAWRVEEINLEPAGVPEGSEHLCALRL